MAEKALTAIQQAYIQGVSTRSVDDLVKAMGMSGISKSQVSRLCGEIDDKVKAFLSRPIEGDWPYLSIDATYLKVRRGGRIVSVTVIIAVGVNTYGRREVLMEIGTSEAEPIWTEFLRKLTRRGLRGVKFVVSDAHEGIKAPFPRSFLLSGKDAGFTSCAMSWLMPARAGYGLSHKERAAPSVAEQAAIGLIRLNISSKRRSFRSAKPHPAFGRLPFMMRCCVATRTARGHSPHIGATHSVVASHSWPGAGGDIPPDI